MPRARIQVTMDDADFGYLTTNSAQWAAEAATWGPAIRRGQFMPGVPGAEIRLIWQRAYWLESGHVALMLARAFLDYWGHDYQLVSDEDGGEWVILTDYQWKQEG